MIIVKDQICYSHRLTHGFGDRDDVAFDANGRRGLISLRVCFVVVASAIAISCASAVTAQSQQTDADPFVVIHRLKVEAQSFCLAPEQYGYKRSVTGKVEGTLNAGKWTKFIASASGTIGASATLEQTSGVAQDQLAKALEDHGRCTNDALKLFTDTYMKLRSASQPREVRIVKIVEPPRTKTLTLTRIVTVFQKPAQVHAKSVPVIPQVTRLDIPFDRNSFKEKFSLGFKPYTWHVIVKSVYSEGEAIAAENLLNREYPKLWFEESQSNENIWMVTLGSGIGLSDAEYLRRIARSLPGMKDAYRYCWSVGVTDPDGKCAA